MNNNSTLFNLPSLSLNILSTCLGISLVGLGVRMALAPNIALKIANHQLIVGTSAKRLEQLARELEQQAELIEQKDEAYHELFDIYKRSLKGNRDYGKLQQKIEQLEKLPEAKTINEVIDEIEATEEILNDSLSE